MHLDVAVQAVLTHNETSARDIRVSEIEQAPHVRAATTAMAAATATATANAGYPAMALLAELRSLAVEQRRVV